MVLGCRCGCSVTHWLGSLVIIPIEVVMAPIVINWLRFRLSGSHELLWDWSTWRNILRIVMIEFIGITNDTISKLIMFLTNQAIVSFAFSTLRSGFSWTIIAYLGKFIEYLSIGAVRSSLLLGILLDFTFFGDWIPYTGIVFLKKALVTLDVADSTCYSEEKCNY